MTKPVFNSVTTSNGSYFVGMTKKEAEQKKIYSCFAGIDFKDLDKNNDGILSQKEILEGVKKQSGREKWSNRLWGIFGAGVATAGAIAELPSVGAATGIIVAGGTLATVAGVKYDAACEREEEAEKALKKYNK